MAHPPSAQLHRRPFVAGLHVGIPITSAAPVGRQRDHPSVRPIRLLHSPSNPELKGTATIREIISDLQRTGMPLELVEIHGRPNAEVRAAILECDLVVDQMYSDQPLAGFATEAAAEGVGIVTSGYAAGDPGALIQHELPVLYVQPQAMAEAIAGLAQDEAARVELGRRSRVFVESHWQPGQVAERFLLMLRGEAPPEWLVDPADITYPLGCGLPESRVARLIHGLVERYGPSALGVDDKPELLARLLAVASTVTESVRTVSESPPDSTNKIGA